MTTIFLKSTIPSCVTVLSSNIDKESLSNFLNCSIFSSFSSSRFTISILFKPINTGLFTNNGRILSNNATWKAQSKLAFLTSTISIWYRKDLLLVLQLYDRMFHLYPWWTKLQHANVQVRWLLASQLYYVLPKVGPKYQVYQ